WRDMLASGEGESASGQSLAPWHVEDWLSSRGIEEAGHRERLGLVRTPRASGSAASLIARTLAFNPLWQREAERRPLAHLALDPDPPAVQLHELLGQREAEPRALLLPGGVPADLAELLEDRCLIRGRDPDPRVADGDGDRVLGCGGGEIDPAALRGELHGV